MREMSNARDCSVSYIWKIISHFSWVVDGASVKFVATNLHKAFSKITMTLNVDFFQHYVRM